MDNGTSQGKFSEGGRMGFEPVESVGLAAKESAQEILKIFNQVHEPRVVHSRRYPAPNTHPPGALDCPAYLIGQRSTCMGGALAARPPTQYPTNLPASPPAVRLTMAYQ